MRTTPRSLMLWCVVITLLAAGTAVAGTAVAGTAVAGTAAPASAVLAARSLLDSESLALNGVYCTSAANCWAVGNTKTGDDTQNQVLHLTASNKWRPVTVPEPGGTAAGDNNNLNAVRCASARDCWAVGDYQALGSARLDQLLHWNGQKWSAVSAPAPGGTSSGDFNELNDVACTSAASCWAVGYYGIQLGDAVVALTQALHWNGKKWSLMTTPNPAGHSKNDANQLNAVRCASAQDCWAAGSDGVGSNFAHRNLMLHWNGIKWTTAHVPDPGGTAKSGLDQIRSLSCSSPVNCWAAGSFGKELKAGHQRLSNQLLHWTGKTWAKVTAPNPDGTGPTAKNELLAITCVTASDCWAVGSAGGASGRPGLNEALRWNGRKWSVVRTPEPGGTNADVANVLTSIRCTGSAICWAVGVVEQSVGAEDQILRWNGAKWRTVLGPA